MTPYRDIAESIPRAPRAKALLKRAFAYFIVFVAAEALLTLICSGCGAVRSWRGCAIGSGIGNALVLAILAVRWALLTLFGDKT